MAEGAPDVVIPIRLDNAKALRALDQLEQRGGQSAEGVQKEMGKAESAVERVGQEGQKAGGKIKQGMDEGGQGVNTVTTAVADLIKTQIGLSAIERAGAAMGTEFKRAADYVRTLAKDFSDLRQTMQQVAALSGQQNSNEFAVEQVEKATKAALTPEEWRGFQEQFQSYGGAYIEGDQSRFVPRQESEDDYQKRVAANAKKWHFSDAEAAKLAQAEGEAPEEHQGRIADLIKSHGMTASAAKDFDRLPDSAGRSAQEQAEEYQQRIAEFAKARGIGAGEAAQLGGGLLQFSEGPQTVEDLEARFGKVFKTLERAPTPVPQLLPQMSRLMAQGASPEEAAELLALQSEANPGEEEVHARQPIKKLNELIIEGKGAELNIKEGMSPAQMIKAASEKLAEDTKADFAVSEEQGNFALNKRLSGLGFTDRELTGMRGFVNRGVRAGGFKRIEEYQKDTPDDFMDEEIKKYEASDAGKQAKRDAEERLAKAQRGAKYEGVLAERQQARTELIEEGEPERGGVGRVIRGAAGWFSGQSADEQLESNRALERAREKARNAGVTQAEIDAQARELGHDVQRRDNLDAAFKTSQEVNDEILTLLRAIAEHGKTTAENTKGKGDKPQTKPPAPLPSGPAFHGRVPPG